MARKKGDWLPFAKMAAVVSFRVGKLQLPSLQRPVWIPLACLWNTPQISDIVFWNFYGDHAVVTQHNKSDSVMNADVSQHHCFWCLQFCSTKPQPRRLWGIGVVIKPITPPFCLLDLIPDTHPPHRASKQIGFLLTEIEFLEITGILLWHRLSRQVKATLDLAHLIR